MKTQRIIVSVAATVGLFCGANAFAIGPIGGAGSLAGGLNGGFNRGFGNSLNGTLGGNASGAGSLSSDAGSHTARKVRDDATQTADASKKTSANSAKTADSAASAGASKSESTASESPAAAAKPSSTPSTTKSPMTPGSLALQGDAATSKSQLSGGASEQGALSLKSLSANEGADPTVSVTR